MFLLEIQMVISLRILDILTKFFWILIEDDLYFHILNNNILFFQNIWEKNPKNSENEPISIGLTCRNMFGNVPGIERGREREHPRIERCPFTKKIEVVFLLKIQMTISFSVLKILTKFFWILIEDDLYFIFQIIKHWFFKTCEGKIQKTVKSGCLWQSKW